MPKNINSFTQTVTDLTRNVNVSLSSMQGMNESLTTRNDTVIIEYEGIDPITGDASTYNYSMPSYTYTLESLSRISNTVNTFVSGKGVVLLDDGTYRQVSTVPLAQSPDAISGVITPTKFKSRSNWFFESFLFPQIYVEFDLKGKIDDRSDRVKARRLLFDNFDDNETTWFKDNLAGNEYSYEDVTNLLNENGKNYWVDEEIQELPLNPTKYTGDFLVTDKRTINSNLWYFIDTLNYGITTDASVVKNIEIKIGDQLRFGQNLFKVDAIETTEKRVRLVSLIGTSIPTIGDKFYIYSTPFEEKITSIPIGYNECNILFIKGINDDFNILADSWGTSISFYTNDLILNNSTTDLESYYFSNVVDFGKQMEGQAKDKQIPAIFGVTPAAPSLSTDQFVVNQVNTQLNASLDTEDIKNTQTQIESTKTIITSLKATIAQQKSELVELTDPAQRDDLQGKIDNNISQLSKKATEYQSLVKSLATLAYENNVTGGTAKYRVRGFFEIPTGKTKTDNASEETQEIMQFEISHRYIRLDNTGNPLNTYSYTDPSTGQKITGTFTDWENSFSTIRKKTYDTTLGRYTWSPEDIASGEEININQVNIPIRKGEKVELRVRSISEAGWPLNPLKSDWSDTVLIKFPANLQGSDQVQNILSDATAEEAQIQLDETLNSTGVITHLQDGYPNPNSGGGTYFKHQARYLSYDHANKDIYGNVFQENSIDLQSVMEDFVKKTFITLTNQAQDVSKTVTLQEAIQRILTVSGTDTIFNALQNQNNQD